MKKILALLLATLLCLAPAVALAEAPDTLLPVKYVVPGDEPAGAPAMMARINEQLAPLGITLSIQYIPWDVWDQKLNLMLSTGEEFDLFHVMQDRVSFSNYYGRGGLSDLTEALEAEGQAIFESIPGDVMDAAKIQGRYYCIPTNWVELGVEGYFTVRTDLLEKYGQVMPTTNAEILDVVEAVIQQYDGAETPYLTFRGGDFDPMSLHTTSLHPEYERYPFTVKDALFFVSQAGEVESWLETEEFKRDCEWMHQAYTRGLIDPDVLAITQDQISDLIGRGIFAISFGTGGSYSEMVKEWPELTPESVQLVRLHAEKGALRPWAFKNCNAVPLSSKHPEAAVRFINWLYSAQENYDLFMYGVEGQQFTIPGEGKIEYIDLDVSSELKWNFADWMIGNMKYIRINAGGFPSVDNARYTVDESAQSSIAGGFFFDPTEVQAEYSNVLTEYAAVMAPICVGVQSYEDYYPAALERMKAAGLDAVVEAYQNQFAAYQAALAG